MRGALPDSMDTLLLTIVTAVILGIVSGPIMTKTLPTLLKWLWRQVVKVARFPVQAARYGYRTCCCRGRASTDPQQGAQSDSQGQQWAPRHTMQEHVDAFWEDVSGSLKSMTTLVTDLWKETSRSCGELKIAQHQAATTLKDSLAEITKTVEKALESAVRHVEKVQFPSPTAVTSIVEQSRTALLQQVGAKLEELSSALQTVMVGHQRQSAQNMDKIRQEVVQRSRELETYDKQQDQHSRKQLEGLKEIQVAVEKIQETLAGHTHVLAKLEDMTGKQEVAMGRFAEAIDRIRTMTEDNSADAEKILASLEGVHERLGPAPPFRQPPLPRQTQGPPASGGQDYGQGTTGNWTGVRPIQLAQAIPAIPVQPASGTMQVSNSRGEILRVVLDHLTGPNP